MTHRTSLFIALVCFVGFICCDMDGDVHILTDDTFDTTLDGSEGPWIVKFFAPWCGHCKTLAPVFKESASIVKGKLNMGEVDCTVHSSVCDRFGVRGYPTLKTFMKGSKNVPGDYNGGRAVEAFVQYADLVPAIRTLDSNELLDTVNRAAAGDRVAFVYFGTPSDALIEAADIRRDRLFFGKTHAAHASSVGVKEDTLAVFRDGSPLEYESGDIGTWIDEHAYLLLPELNQQTYMDVIMRGKPAVIAAINPNTDSAFRTKFKNTVVLSGDTRFAFAWLNGVMFEEFLRSIGVAPDALPVIMSWDGKNNDQKMAPEQVSSLSDVGDFNAWLEETHVLWSSRQTFTGKISDLFLSLIELINQHLFLAVAVTSGLVGLVVALYRTTKSEDIPEQSSSTEEADKKDE